jgi:hypothetical protein
MMVFGLLLLECGWMCNVEVAAPVAVLGYPIVVDVCSLFIRPSSVRVPRTYVRRPRIISHERILTEPMVS